jgi:hypothetical protein
MKQSAWIAIVLLMVSLGPLTAFAAPSGKVDLPLKDYLALVETAERAEKQKAEELARREKPVAEVVSQRVAVTVGAREAAIVSDFEVLLQGKTLTPVLLPLAGFPETIEVRDEAGKAGAAAVAAAEGGVMLTAPQPGRYTVHVTSRAGLETEGGNGSLDLGTVAAPVASTEIDLPADRSWEGPGTVVVDETEQNGRRHVRLATARGIDTVLEVRRKVDSAEAEKLLAESVVLTILQLRPEGLRRHDVVLYEVRRGSLSRFTVELPPGLEIEQAGTDEGTVVPVVETGRLTVHRQRQLQGVGYLVLSSTPPSLAALPADGLALEAVKPETEVRARYLAISSAVAADVRPLPEPSWSRVDLSDLPAVLSEALAALDLAAAWRLAGDGADTRLAVAQLPAAPRIDATIRRRDTTTLLTVDGTLLFRDRFLVETRSRAGAALDVKLPAGGVLWSTKVDDQAVRPLERGGMVSVPLGFSSGAVATVEVVSVLERALPPGRSQLALDLPLVNAPVLIHELRLLLPEKASYRVRQGTLRFVPPGWSGSARYYDFDSFEELDTGSLPAGKTNLHVKAMDEQGNLVPGAVLTLQNGFGIRVGVTNSQGVAVLNVPGGQYALKAEHEGFSSQELPNLQLPDGRNLGLEVVFSAAVEDVITVQAEPRLLQDARLSAGAKAGENEVAEEVNSRLLRQEVEGLQQGLVGGVKPLPVSIPESGKALAFSAVLPPSRVTVELDVKAKGKS